MYTLVIANRVSHTKLHDTITQTTDKSKARRMAIDRCQDAWFELTDFALTSMTQK